MVRGIEGGKPPLALLDIGRVKDFASEERGLRVGGRPMSLVQSLE